MEKSSKNNIITILLVLIIFALAGTLIYFVATQYLKTSATRDNGYTVKETTQTDTTTAQDTQNVTPTVTPTVTTTDTTPATVSTGKSTEIDADISTLDGLDLSSQEGDLSDDTMSDL